MEKFREYQTEARRTLNTNTTDRLRLANLGMGLAGEAGEVCDYLKKVVFHDHPLDRERLSDELGDVLWYLANLTDALGVSLDDVAEDNIAKLRARYPDGFEAKRSRARS